MDESALTIHVCSAADINVQHIVNGHTGPLVIHLDKAAVHASLMMWIRQPGPQMLVTRNARLEPTTPDRAGAILDKEENSIDDALFTMCLDDSSQHLSGPPYEWIFTSCMRVACEFCGAQDEDPCTCPDCATKDGIQRLAI